MVNAEATTLHIFCKPFLTRGTFKTKNVNKHIHTGFISGILGDHWLMIAPLQEKLSKAGVA